MAEKIEGNVAEVIADVKKQIEGYGGDYTKFKEGFEKAWADFEAAHKKATEDGSKDLGETKAQFDKHISDVLSRMEANEKFNTEATKRMDQIETLSKRSRLSQGTPEQQEQKHAEALELKKLGYIQGGMMPLNLALEDGDLEAHDLYIDSFKRYLRKGDEPGIIKPEDRKALSVGSDPDGGYWVSPQMSSRIISKIYETSPIRQLASVETTSTGELEMMVDRNEAGAGWVGEPEARTETDTPEIGKKLIVAHEMYAKPKATQKLLEDAAINVEAWLGNKVSNKFTRLENTAFVSGTGVNQPRGFLTYPDGTTWGTIEHIPTGASAGFTYAGLVNIMTGLPEYYLANSTWMATREAMAAILVLEDSGSFLIFRPTLGGGPGGERVFFPNLLGYPMRLAADLDALGADSLSLVFGDWAEAYQIVDRLGIQVLRDPFSNKPHVEFYTRRRVGGDVVNYDAIKLGTCNTT